MTTPGHGWCHAPCRNATRRACSPMAWARSDRRWTAYRVGSGISRASRIGHAAGAVAAELWTTEKYPIGLWITGLVRRQHADVRREHGGSVDYREISGRYEDNRAREGPARHPESQTRRV